MDCGVISHMRAEIGTELLQQTWCNWSDVTQFAGRCTRRREQIVGRAGQIDKAGPTPGGATLSARVEQPFPAGHHDDCVGLWWYLSLRRSNQEL